MRDRETGRSLSVGLLAVVLVSLAWSAALAEPDIELNWNFLKFGMTRAAVVKILGEPSAESKSIVVIVEHRKLFWFADRVFVATFVQDRLLHWKRCDRGVARC